MPHVSSAEVPTAWTSDEGTGALRLPENVSDTHPLFVSIVENVRTGHPDGLSQLYRVLCSLSGSLRRQIGFQDFDDRLHDTFIAVAEAIRAGKLRDPSALASYIHGVARLALWSKIDVRARHSRLSGLFCQTPLFSLITGCGTMVALAAARAFRLLISRRQTVTVSFGQQLHGCGLDDFSRMLAGSESIAPGVAAGFLFTL